MLIRQVPEGIPNWRGDEMEEKDYKKSGKKQKTRREECYLHAFSGFVSENLWLCVYVSQGL